MTPNRLLAHFHRLAEAPDAIPRLRRFILDLAVRGKLVEQNSEDEPASELLRRIRDDEEREHCKGRNGSGKPVPVPKSDEFPFDVPGRWQWTCLGKLIVFGPQNGISPKPSTVPDAPKAISLTATTSGKFDPKYFKRVDADVPQDSEFWLRPGDLLFQRGNTREYVGMAAFYDGEPGQFLYPDLMMKVRLSEQVSLAYIHLCAVAPLGRSYFSTNASGAQASMPKINQQTLLRLPIPLPPFAEQHRIVAKVDELMALCDRLEASKAERESRRDRLIVASLHRLNNGTNADAFREHARFHLRNLPRLTTRPEHIAQLRRTILNLAVRGKLAPQDPGDEPASELLKQIREHRTELLKQGYPNEDESRTQLRKQEQQRLPAELSPLPQGWQWATLMQCSALVVDCHNKTAPYTREGILLLRTTNIRDGRLNLAGVRYVDEPTYCRWSARCEPAPGDILITREAPMGEVCKIPKGMQVCLGQRMMLVRLLPDTIDPEFLVYSLRDPQLMDRVQDKPVGATVQHLRVGGVETLLVPLPPLAEQRRIVAKVEELMALCDRLEAQLTTSQTESHRLLLEAILHEALGSAA